MIFIIKGFRTIVFIFIVISTTFRPICRLAFFRCLSNSGIFNKGHSSMFREGSQVRQTPEEGRSTYRLKRCGNSNKDEDNSPKTLNDKNHQASSQKFRQLRQIALKILDANNVRLNLKPKIFPSEDCVIQMKRSLRVHNFCVYIYIYKQDENICNIPLDKRLVAKIIK